MPILLKSMFPLRPLNNLFDHYFELIRRRILTPMEHRSYMRGNKLAYLSLISLILIFLPHSQIYAETSSEGRNFTIDVLEVAAHNETSFTQGLEMFDGNMLERSGLYGKSRLSETDIVTGEVIRQIIFNESIFSEGITVREGSVIMLTWREQIAFEVDLNDFQVIGNYSYQGEGWGLCFNGNHLVMTNGSSDLIFRDPYSFEVDYTIRVVLDGVEIVNPAHRHEYQNDFQDNEWT